MMCLFMFRSLQCATYQLRKLFEMLSASKGKWQLSVIPQESEEISGTIYLGVVYGHRVKMKMIEFLGTLYCEYRENCPGLYLRTE